MESLGSGPFEFLLATHVGLMAYAAVVWRNQKQTFRACS
jgi:hypothetical protein